MGNNNITTIAIVKRALLLRNVFVNDEHKYKIYNIVYSGGKYKLYRGNASLIAAFSYRDIRKLVKGEVLYYQGKSIELI